MFKICFEIKGAHAPMSQNTTPHEQNKTLLYIISTKIKIIKMFAVKLWPEDI
jgi:hypothetical protein